jgi:hypothetical protein
MTSRVGFKERNSSSGGQPYCLSQLSTLPNAGRVGALSFSDQDDNHCYRDLSGTICPIGLRQRESGMSKPGPDGRHRDKNGVISSKHGDTLVRTLRKIYGQGFAAGYPETEKLSEVLLQLNETSLSQLRRDHETNHLEHKISQASK